MTHEDDGTTTLAGPVADQAQLHGLLAKIRDLGVTLVSVEVVDATVTDRQAPGAAPTSSSHGSGHAHAGEPGSGFACWRT